MGALSPSAVRNFLARPRRDFRAYHRISEPELDRLMRRLPETPPIWTKLNHSQKRMFVIGARTRRFLFFADCGLGKTFLSIALARYYQQLGAVSKVLVLVPRRTVKEEWLDEVRKHAPELKIALLPSDIEGKWQTLQTTDALLVVDTYGGFLHMATKLEKVKKGRKRGKNKLQLNPTLMHRLGKLINGMVLDEVHAAKNKKKLPYRICRKLAQNCAMVFGLTATPFGRDPGDLWGQFYLVDGGYTLGETLGLFRKAFFKETVNYWGISEYNFDSKKQRLLNRCLADRSIHFQADQASLPALVTIVKKVNLPTDAETHYERAKQTLQKAGNYREMKNAFLRMRQISSGFVGFMDDDSGKKAEFKFDDNPKLDLLLSLLETIDQRYQIIIFHEFIFSGDMIAAELKQLKISFTRMFSGTRDVRAARDGFNSGKYRVLLLQNSFGEGLNLQQARYGIYWESPVSPIMRYQTRRRYERQHSQHKTVFQYDLVVKDTVDERILEFLKEGADLFDSIVKGKTKV